MFSNQDKMQKIYITENKIWREEIIKYIKTKTNRKYYLDLIENSNFIIRIYERTDYKREQYFLHQIITNYPNIAKVFIMIQPRDLPLINNKRKELIDIEKKYEKNIKNLILNKNTYYDFLKQMIYCQINLFIAHGVTHNNIHEGNIFMENNNDDLIWKHCDEKCDYIYINKTINYKYINKNIISNTRYILSDFTQCRIYNPEYTCGIDPYYNYNISIIKNLEDTLKLGKKLFNVDYLIDCDVSNEIKEKCVNIFIKNYDVRDINYEKNYKNFNKETVNLCWEYVEPILEKIKEL